MRGDGSDSMYSGPLSDESFRASGFSGIALVPQYSKTGALLKSRLGGSWRVSSLRFRCFGPLSSPCSHSPSFRA